MDRAASLLGFCGLFGQFGIFGLTLLWSKTPGPEPETARATATVAQARATPDENVQGSGFKNHKSRFSRYLRRVGTSDYRHLNRNQKVVL